MIHETEGRLFQLKICFRGTKFSMACCPARTSPAIANTLAKEFRSCNWMHEEFHGIWHSRKWVDFRDSKTNAVCWQGSPVSANDLVASRNHPHEHGKPYFHSPFLNYRRLSKVYGRLVMKDSMGGGKRGTSACLHRDGNSFLGPDLPVYWGAK